MISDLQELATIVTNPIDKHAHVQRIITSTLNQVMKIANDYYSKKEKIMSEEATITTSL